MWRPLWGLPSPSRGYLFNMYIAKKLRETNIAEYLLYMWQVEDIIRANGLNMDRLRENYLSQFPVEGEEEQELECWYANLIRMMREEGVTEKGHLQINKNIVSWLTDLHNKLLSSSQFPSYSAAYYQALPFIVELRQRGGDKQKPELENCFDALYGIMLLRLQKKPVSKGTEHAARCISRLLGMLSAYYKQEETGEMKLN